MHTRRNAWIDFQRRVFFHLEIIMCMDSKIHAQSKSSIKEVNKFEFVLDSKGELNNEKIRYFLANIFKSRKRGN